MQSTANRPTRLGAPIGIAIFLVWVSLLAVLPNRPVLIGTAAVLALVTAPLWMGLLLTILNFASWPLQRHRSTRIYAPKSQPRLRYVELSESELAVECNRVLHGLVDLRPRQGWRASGTQIDQFLCEDAHGQLITIMCAPDLVFAASVRGVFWYSTNTSHHGQRERGLALSRHFDHDWNVSASGGRPAWIEPSVDMVTLKCTQCGQLRLDVFHVGSLRLVAYPLNEPEEPTTFVAHGIFLMKSVVAAQSSNLAIAELPRHDRE